MDEYGIIVNEKLFDSGSESSNRSTESVKFNKNFNSVIEAMEYYDKKWKGQEYYLVRWENNKWVEIS